MSIEIEADNKCPKCGKLYGTTRIFNDEGVFEICDFCDRYEKIAEYSEDSK